MMGMGCQCLSANMVPCVFPGHVSEEKIRSVTQRPLTAQELCCSEELRLMEEWGIPGGGIRRRLCDSSL